MLRQLLLLLIFLTPTTFSLLCYQCASELAVLNWSRYGFPMTEGDSMVSDNNCIRNETVSAHISCNGVCITYNVTREDNGKTIAVVRDCLHKNKMHRYKESRCIERSIHSRRTRLNVTSCICDHDYCNGPPALTTRRAMRRFLSDPSGAASLTWISMICMFLFLRI